MAQIQVTRTYNRDGKRCFEAAKAGFPQVGFAIWKVRELAYLVIANREQDGKIISANMIAFGSEPTDVTLSISSDGHSEEELTAFVEPIYTAFEAALGEG